MPWQFETESKSSMHLAYPEWERNYCPSSGHHELALPRSKVQVTRQDLQICQERHNRSSYLEAKRQENHSVALEIIGNSKINYKTWSNSCVPGDMEDSPLIDVFQPKMWLLPSKRYFRQTQVLGSIKVTGPRYRGSQTGWSILAFINLQNSSTGTLPGMPEIETKAKALGQPCTSLPQLLSLLPAWWKQWELQPPSWGQFG